MFALVAVAASDGAKPVAADLPACGEINRDGWVALPDTPLGSLVDVDPDPRDVRRLLATDGTDVAVSLDGACTWQTVSRPTTTRTASGNVRLHDVEIGHLVGGGARLWALGFLDEAVVNRPPVLFRSDDGGRSWVEVGRGVAPVRPLMGGDCGPGGPCGLAVVPDEPDTVLLRVGDHLESGVVYRSEDAGETFSRTSGGGFEIEAGVGGASFRSNGGFVDFEALGRDLVVGVDRTNLRVSTDGGRTYSAVLSVSFDIDLVAAAGGNVDLSSLGMDREALVAFAIGRLDRGTDQLIGSVLPGAARLTAPSPGGALRSVDVSAAGSPVVLSDEGVTAYPLSTVLGDPIDLGFPAGTGHQRVQVVGAATESVVWVHGPQGLSRRTADLALPLPEVPVGPAIALPDFDPAVPLGPVPGTMTPSVETVQLDPGEVTEVTYDFRVPERKVPVDVFFLFDESGSMSEEIDALRQGVADIVDDLEERDVDLWVGVGGYANELRYQRYREIGPPDAEFDAALRRAGTGRQAWNETVYTAVHQIATGSGIPGGGAPRGHNAEWRPGAIRIVINLGDEPLQAHPGDPTREDAIEAARRQRILHIGLVSETELLSDGAQWRSFTAATGALAGPSGVDCDRDGLQDVEPGGPIVCFIPLIAATDALSDAVELLPDMAGVVVEVVDAVTEVVPVTFHTDRPDVVTGLTSTPRLQAYDLHSGVRATLTAAMTCTPALFGQRFPVRVTAVAQASHLASAVVQFGCGVPPAAAVPPQASAPPAVALASAPAPAAAPPPPAPPAQAVSTASSTASSAAHAPAPGVQGAVAGAQQRQTQVQAAGLGPSGPARDDAPEFLATARRDEPVGLTVGGAVLLSGLFAATMLRERRRARSVARVSVSRLR